MPSRPSLTPQRFPACHLLSIVIRGVNPDDPDDPASAGCVTRVSSRVKRWLDTGQGGFVPLSPSRVSEDLRRSIPILFDNSIYQ